MKEFLLPTIGLIGGVATGSVVDIYFAQTLANMDIVKHLANDPMMALSVLNVFLIPLALIPAIPPTVLGVLGTGLMVGLQEGVQDAIGND